MTGLADVLAKHRWDPERNTCFCGHPRYMRWADHFEHQVQAVTAAGLAVIELPSVAYKGPNDTDAKFFRQAADRIDTGTNVYIGGGNVRAAVSDLLRSAADAAEAVRS